MKKIAFVTPWFGMDIPGGAEAELRGLVLHLAEYGQEVEVLSTCVRSFNDDWNYNYHKAGLTVEAGIPVRRFKVRKRNTEEFNRVNYKLMHNQLSLSSDDEKVFVEEMINSPALYEYMRAYHEDYSLFVFIPYMFGTTYYGLQVRPEKSVLIPCLHDEKYIYMDVFKEVFPKAAGMIFNAKPECELAHRVYDLSEVNTKVLGVGIDTELEAYPKCFREKYHINDPFILYAGRKDSGKNVDTLIKYFCEYKKRNASRLKLVLIGGGQIGIPDAYKADIIDLGFIPIQDKYNAYGAAELLCQPSHNESFSIVIMESWLCDRPVLVSGKCPVTKNFAIESNGGLYFDDYFEFEGCINYILAHESQAEQMGRSGRAYVKEHFEWSRIIQKYLRFFEEIVNAEI